MTTQRQNNLLLGRAAADNIRYWAGGRWRRCRPTPGSAGRVPADFIGICVASSPDAAGDDYVIARLKELGIRTVRLDFTYDSRNSYGERFLKRLLDDSFRVCLHLVQPPAEVKALPDPGAQERWRVFVAETLAAYAARLDMVEIGSTCNRRRWSGYTPAAFLLSWQIAWEEAQRHKVRLAAPNVTDFEPFYNVAILSELKRGGMLPALHTDNLFVERATEPEAYDHKILGRRLAGLLRFNLIRKAQVLGDIGRWAGVPETVCAHVAWSLRRIARLLDHIEEKQADYVARYAWLAAASGALRRFYWGPLIGQREGLIDDRTSDYPDIPHVAYYGHIRGGIAGYRVRPAFYSLQTVNRFMAGAEFRRKIPSGPGLEILEFALPSSAILPQPSDINHPEAFRARDHQPLTILHIAWTTNGNAAEAAACYAPGILETAEIYSRDGARLPQAPLLFTESPTYLVWPTSSSEAPRGKPRGILAKPSEAKDAILSSIAALVTEDPPCGNLLRPRGYEGREPQGFLAKEGEEGERSAIRDQRSENESKIASRKSKIGFKSPLPGIIPGVRFAPARGTAYAPLRCREWTGFCLAQESGLSFDVAPLLEMLPGRSDSDPDGARPLPHSAVVLRDSRNRVWSLPSPADRSRRLVIKQFRPRGFWRRLLQRHQPDRAQRSWNGAQELLRRGIPTPQPVAFIRAAEHPGLQDCYYICRAFENGWSTREAFTAFSRGATRFQGKPEADLFEAIARFLRTLHDRGVFFRDLSAGNLLLRCAAETEVEFALIDTARARFYPASVSLRQRLSDLMRLCHPLDWEGREAFVGTYLQCLGRRFSFWLKIPFAYYDAKHWVKNAVKRLKA